LFVFADKQQDQIAKGLFKREIQEGGDVIITGTEGSMLRIEVKDRPPSLAQLKVDHHPLTPREQILAIAFVLMLRNNVEESSEKMMKLLLDPWMKAAKDQFDQQQ
jgi:hypothetical protein